MLRTALRLDHPAQRDLCWLADDFVRFPIKHHGSFRDRRELSTLLESQRLVAVFPEGPQAFDKPFYKRYELGPFHGGGYVEAAARTRAPIIPVGIVGNAEAHPVLFRVAHLGRFVGLPSLPVTPTFPWLGPLGLIPFPSRWAIVCGEPMYIDTDCEDPQALAAQEARVRDAVSWALGEARNIRG